MTSFRALLAERYPLTTLGTVAAVSLFALLLNAFRTGSIYELTVALFGIGVLSVLTVVVQAQVRAFAALLPQLALQGRLVAGRRAAPVRLTGITRRTAPFTRVHAVVHAELQHTPAVKVHMRREAASAGAEAIVVLLPAPLSGRLRFGVTTELRDVFALVRAQFGRRQERSEVVLPGPPVGARPYDIQSYAGAEEHQRHSATEQERYYMREYTPGDRFRDINWKASSRLAILLTRVSPHSEEPTTVVQIDIRHFRNSKLPPSLDSVLHLEMLRAWVLWFVRSIAAKDTAAQFRIRTADQTLEAKDEGEIDFIAERLAVLPYLPPRAEKYDRARTEGEWFVFSTPYDIGFANRGRAPREHAFMTAAGGDSRKHAYRVALFTDKRVTALPGAWVLRRERRIPQPVAEHTGGLFETLPILPRVL